MMKAIGVYPKVFNIIRYMYDYIKCAVLFDGRLTEWFEVMVGVRQGWISSPSLFNLFLEYVAVFSLFLPVLPVHTNFFPFPDIFDPLFS